MLERIRAIILERLLAARALIDSYNERPPMADGSTPKDEA